jgi:calcium-dependent protein kinase
MGNCYCKQGPVSLNINEIGVYEKENKNEESKKDTILKTTNDNNTLHLNLDKKKGSKRRVSFFEDPEKQKEKEKNRIDNNDYVKRRIKQKVFHSVKSPEELIQFSNQMKLENYIENDESVTDDKILNFASNNESEISNISPKKKFKRRNKRSVTGVDKSQLNKKLIKFEKSIRILTENLIIQQKGNLNENYEIIKKLGVGTLGTVYKAKNKYLKNIVAIKMIKKIKENEDDNEIINEINKLKKLSHPNIVRIHEFYCNQKYHQIITEYCKKGDLNKYIRNNLSEKQLAVIFYQIFSGLCYLHENNIIHGNIKLKNIMLLTKEEDNQTKEEYFWVKIIDFSIDKIFNKNKQDSLKYSSYYKAPEMFQNKFSDKTDMWSIGIILFLALTGKVPFDGRTDDEISNKIQNYPYNDLEPMLLAHSSEAKDLLDKLLEKDMEKRISAKQALNHEWFKNYHGRALFSNFRLEEIQQYIHNLCSYSSESKISQLVLAFLVHNIPISTSTYIILKLFRFFNTSGNCKLTKDELKKGLYNYRNKEQVNEIVEELFLVLDGGNNGYIELEEFYRACVNKKELLTKKNIWYAFKFLDENNTNTIELRTLMKAFDAEPNKMLEAVFNKTLNKEDNNTGIMTFQEFEEMMLNTMKD